MKIELEEQEINLLKSIIARTEEQAEGVQISKCQRDIF